MLIIKEVRTFGGNINLLVNMIYGHFINLTNVKRLKHNKKEINRLLRSKKLIALLMYNRKGKIIAYMIGEIMRLNDGRIVYYISYLYVVSFYRSRGIGSKLLDTMINKCKSLEMDSILLTCDTNNKIVYDFYLLKGFMPDLVLRTYDRYDVLSIHL